MEQGKIVLVGAGNVARHLSAALLSAGGNICQVYSRGAASAGELGRRVGAGYTTDPREVIADGDIYLFCTSDDALPAVLESLTIAGDPLLLHVSGSLPAGVLAPYSRDHGVIYPLQTFSRGREIDFKEIPLFIEGSSPAVLERLRGLCGELGGACYPTDLEQRRRLHLAAVFACNFPNALYRVAGRLLEGSGITFPVLRPLILETARKMAVMSPAEAQTGPAYRGDEGTLARHREQLEAIDREALEIYALLSDLIRRGREQDNLQ
ncbi:MAG: DUF2520 domain-containing protein [Odoribacteraceae bacterium]|nr:DUF2520 domain-containing protein [Odoribacteraceae bacterium]